MPNSSSDRDPTRSINFVTAHDGFTLNDLVSYDAKHNMANGEDNRDGSDSNDSWNCGVEGLTDDPLVGQLRGQQVRNFFMALLVSQGRPMMLMGDEVRRTQRGNNNTYCQDNELSWYDWDLVKGEAGVLRFGPQFLAFRRGSFLFTDHHFWGEPGSGGLIWHGVELHQPDFGEDSHSLALELIHPARAEHLYVIFNAFWEALDFSLPVLPDGQFWRGLVDTAQPSPQDFPDLPQPLADATCLVAARSTVILIADQGSRESTRSDYQSDPADEMRARESDIGCASGVHPAPQTSGGNS